MGNLIISRARNSKHLYGYGRFYGTLAILLASVIVLQPVAAAPNYDAQIQQLQTQNDANASTRTGLQTQEITLASKIANLQATIAGLEEQIRTNQARQAELAIKIAETEQEIARQKELLGVSVRRMYIDNDVSMLEKMASSRNFSEFVEKEEYGMSVQTEIQSGIKRINQLKKQLEQQKTLVEKLLDDNKAMQAKVEGEKQEVARLLALNQEQQASYTQAINVNNSQITGLQRQQAEENARFLREQAALVEAARRKAAQASASRGNAPAPAPPVAAQAPAGVSAVNGRAYPYANAPYPNEMVDKWGMYQRECVSYTAWKVAASGRHMPYWGGRGNANQWDDNARAAGIPVSSNPRVGDVAVRNQGFYGHVMYVEAVNGDGTIRISQYNAAWDGRYSEATIVPNGLVFIHFR